LEVVIATLLVGLLVGPLATAFAGTIKTAQRVRDEAASSGKGAAPVVDTGAWEWGARVVSAWWRPGPVLHLRLAGAGDAANTQVQLGMWADGWLVVEQSVTFDFVSAENTGGADTDDVQLGPALWSGLNERDLVIRTRIGDGPWGPPWRLAIPGPAGEAPAPGVTVTDQSASRGVVVHRPGVGSTSLTASWDASPLLPPPFGLFFGLVPTVDGWGGTTLDARSQWWRIEEGRDVDVYY
jgi:hypothetical protein